MIRFLAWGGAFLVKFKEEKAIFGDNKGGRRRREGCLLLMTQLKEARGAKVESYCLEYFCAWVTIEKIK